MFNIMKKSALPRSPMMLSVVAVICLCGASAQSAVSIGPGSLTGVWLNSDYKSSARYDIRDGIIRSDDGQMPPLQPWAAQLFDKRVKMSDDGTPFATTKSNCLPAGVPQAMFGPSLPIEILETSGKVTILFTEFSNFRQIFLNSTHANDPDPSFMGDSIGHWEGPVLIVDTIGVTDRTTLDPVGMPHSDALHLTERFRRTGEDTLEVVVTIDDPKVFTRVWTVTSHFKAMPGTRLQENLCENNRNRPNADDTIGIQLAAPNK